MPRVLTCFRQASTAAELEESGSVCIQPRRLKRDLNIHCPLMKSWEVSLLAAFSYLDVTYKFIL